MLVGFCVFERRQVASSWEVPSRLMELGVGVECFRRSIGAGLFLPYRKRYSGEPESPWLETNSSILLTVFQQCQEVELRAKRRKRLTNGRNRNSRSSRSLTR